MPRSCPGRVSRGMTTGGTTNRMTHVLAYASTGPLLRGLAAAPRWAAECCLPMIGARGDITQCISLNIFHCIHQSLGTEGIASPCIAVITSCQPLPSFWLCAGAKKGAGDGLKFEAEATAYLANANVPLTNDKPKYAQQNITAPVCAILSRNGFVQSTAVRSPCAVPFVLLPLPLCVRPLSFSVRPFFVGGLVPPFLGVGVRGGNRRR